jgi:RNA-directed DNA polymerase
MARGNTEPSLRNPKVSSPDGKGCSDIHRHVKVRQNKSPFDGDWAYWTIHLGKSPELPKTKAALLRQQHGKCTFCGLFFASEDVLEIGHILPHAHGGRNEYANWQLLHRHCHDCRTGIDNAIPITGTHDKSQTVEEL